MDFFSGIVVGALSTATIYLVIKGIKKGFSKITLF